jgi:hypothetical protein
MVEALQGIVQTALGECAVVAVNAMPEWEAACGALKYFIAVSHYPQPEFCDHIDCSPEPAIIIADNPLRCLAHVAREHVSDIAAIRAISASFSCLAGALARSEAELQISNARNLQAFVGSLDAEGTIDARDVVRIQLDLNKLVNRLASVSSFRTSMPSTGATSDLAELVLPRLADLQTERDTLHLCWPAGLFSLADFPDTPISGPVELAGPGRCLIYGPYLHLPAGHWMASIALELVGEDDTQSFTVEVVCKDVIAKARIVPNGTDRMDVELDFVHRDPHEPIELRLVLQAGTIDGAITGFEVGFRLVDRKPNRLAS